MTPTEARSHAAALISESTGREVDVDHLNEYTWPELRGYRRVRMDLFEFERTSVIFVDGRPVKIVKNAHVAMEPLFFLDDEKKPGRAWDELPTNCEEFV